MKPKGNRILAKSCQGDVEETTNLRRQRSMVQKFLTWTCQRIICLSAPTETSLDESGDHAMDKTMCVCSLKDTFFLALLPTISYTVTCSSTEQSPKSFPHGLKHIFVAPPGSAQRKDPFGARSPCVMFCPSCRGNSKLMLAQGFPLLACKISRFRSRLCRSP